MYKESMAKKVSLKAKETYLLSPLSLCENRTVAKIQRLKKVWGDVCFVCVCVCVCMCGHDGLSDKKRGTIIRPSPTQSVGCVTARVCAAFPIEMRQNGGIQILIIPFPSGGAKAAFQSEEDKKKTLSLSLSLSLFLTPWHEYLLGGGAQQTKTT